MHKSQYGKYTPWTIDECPECHNIWLDEGELEDIQVAYEIYEDNLNKKMPHNFKCPKCGFAQVKGHECSNCGIIFEKYLAATAKKTGQQKA